MGCKCSAEEHLSEVASLNGQIENNSKRDEMEKDINNIPNPFKTPTKISPLINDDTATTAKSQSDIDRRLLCESILKEINDIRMDPRSYIAKVKHYKENIYYKDGQSYLKIDESSSIKLKNGIKAFDDCISFLGMLKPMDSLQFSEFLTIKDFTSLSNSDNLISECSSVNFLSKAIDTKIEELKGIYDIKNFHYDKTTFSPSISVLSQIVDDSTFTHQRRNNIFDSSTDSIGISAIKINTKPNIYCIYLVFGKKIEDNNNSYYV